MIGKVEQKDWKDVGAEVVNSEDLAFSNDTFTRSFASFLMAVIGS
jgi:hypothetical protein